MKGETRKGEETLVGGAGAAEVSSEDEAVARRVRELVGQGRVREAAKLCEEAARRKVECGRGDAKG